MTRPTSRLLPAALLALLACREEPPPKLVINSCLTDLNCGGGEGVICDQSTLMCVRHKTIEPYELVLKIQPERSSVELPDGGRVGLVAQTAIELGMLDGGIDDLPLRVPEAIRSQGRVVAEVRGASEPLESELTLTPRMNGAQLLDTIVNSAAADDRKDDGGVNVEAMLDPMLTYDLEVQPLLEYSKMLPPYRSTSPYRPTQPLDIEYPTIQELKARLTSDLFSWAGHRVRLEDKATGRVVSSTEEVQRGDADGGVRPDGMFTLHAEPKTFLAPNNSLLAIDLSPLGFSRWQVKIMLDGSRLSEGAQISLPRVPPTVRVGGTVLNADTQAPLPNASLEIVSSFPVRPQYVGDANWCTLRQNVPSPELACSARLTATTDTEGRFEIWLIPGVYDLYALPDRAASPDRTTIVVELVVENVDVERGGITSQDILVGAATRYYSEVGTTSQQPMPNIAVNGRALGVYEPGLPDSGDAKRAQYNRSMGAITDAQGEFTLYPDVGRYDFSVEPPAESGYAWMLCPNYLIRSRDQRPVHLRPFFPPTPVIVAGRVEHRDVPLPNARIDAYAVWNIEPPRLLLIGRSVSNAEGKFRLALPPQLPPTDRNDTQRCPIQLEPPEAGAGALTTVDSGLIGMDAGTERAEASAATADSERPAR